MSASTTPALEITNLTKQYSNGTQALSDINLSIKQGDFFALLGSNGAGKTTTIHIIAGLLKKSSGVVKALGVNQLDSPNKVKSSIGLMGQEFNFSLFEPIEEVLINQAGYYGITRDVATPRAHELLKKVELFDKRKEMVQMLSGGMKRRLMLARALMHKPKILILDEPTAGVDIEIRRSLWTFLRQLNAQGTTIILTTHYLEEAEQLCRNIAIINKGKVLVQTSMRDLLSQADSQTLLLESKTTLPKKINLTDIDYRYSDDCSLVVILKSTQTINDLLNKLSKQGIEIHNIKQTQNRLETLFLKLTGQTQEVSHVDSL